MELIFPFKIPVLVGIFAFVLFLYYVMKMTRTVHGETTSKSRGLAPEAAGAWPLMGHLHLLAGPQLPHKTLGLMADKYGPIFTIRLGVHRALIVSSWEIAKECFTTNDRVISTRPKSIAMETLGYNYAMLGFSPYGTYWREMRKIATLELLSSHRLAMLMTPILESEIKSSLKEIYDLWVKNKNESNKDLLIEMKRWFGGLTLNLIVSIVVGKQVQDDRWHGALRDFAKLAGMFTLSDAFPFLRWLDLGGYEKAMKKTAKELDHVMQGWLKEHKQKKTSSGGKDEKYFMDVMLSSLDGGTYETSNFDVDTINKATCLALISAANDTTAITLTWCLSLLLNNYHILKKVQDELSIHVGKERQVKESDLKNLVYLQAVVKETLRLYPAAPFLLPHEFMEDCKVGGYIVPVGTQIFFNLSKIHRDPRVWPDPLEFRPERFLTTHKNVDIRGQHFELLPFGSGRRVCPGISFAVQVVQLTMASVLHGFEVATPSNEPVDMTESIGLTNEKSTPLEVILTPCLSVDTYG